MPVRITIFGRPGCHLCDDAEETVAQLVDGSGATIEVINIEHDEELHRRFLEKIPVIEIDGEQIAELAQYRRKPFAQAVRERLSN
ncbi:MAG: glutaredoxin family protein [Solirubrobacterales bacterium]